MNSTHFDKLRGGPYKLICDYLESTEALEQTSKSVRNLTLTQRFSEFLQRIDDSSQLTRSGISQREITTAVADSIQNRDLRIKQAWNPIHQKLLLQNQGYLSDRPAPRNSDWKSIPQTLEKIEGKKGEILIEFFKKFGEVSPEAQTHLSSLEGKFATRDPQMQSPEALKKAENIRSWMSAHSGSLEWNRELTPPFPQEVTLFSNLSPDDIATILYTAALDGHIATIESLLLDPRLKNVPRIDICLAIEGTISSKQKAVAKLLLEHYIPLFERQDLNKCVSHIATFGHFEYLKFFNSRKEEIYWGAIFYEEIAHRNLASAKTIHDHASDLIDSFSWDNAIIYTARNGQFDELTYLLENYPYPYEPGKFLYKNLENYFQTGHLSRQAPPFSSFLEKKSK